jgi:hypothetical protein
MERNQLFRLDIHGSKPKDPNDLKKTCLKVSSHARLQWSDFVFRCNFKFDFWREEAPTLGGLS